MAKQCCRRTAPAMHTWLACAFPWPCRHPRSIGDCSQRQSCIVAGRMPVGGTAADRADKGSYTPPATGAACLATRAQAGAASAPACMRTHPPPCAPAVRRSGAACRQMRQILSEADENDDNVIQYKEFMPIMIDILQSIKVLIDWHSPALPMPMPASRTSPTRLGAAWAAPPPPPGLVPPPAPFPPPASTQTISFSPPSPQRCTGDGVIDGFASFAAHEQS
jgi:hypothetical protein